jgi:hypothetical protein
LICAAANLGIRHRHHGPRRCPVVPGGGQDRARPGQKGQAD